jgi:hypothetical protein
LGADKAKHGKRRRWGNGDPGGWRHVVMPAPMKNISHPSMKIHMDSFGASNPSLMIFFFTRPMDWIAEILHPQDY